VLVVQRVFRAKRTNLHEKYDYPDVAPLRLMDQAIEQQLADPLLVQARGDRDGAQQRDVTVDLGAGTADNFAVGDGQQVGVEVGLGAVQR
jgi:hypothetical protein